MKIDGIPLEFVDDLLGDSDSREALVRSMQKAISDFDPVEDATGYSDSGIIAELEKTHLLELLVGDFADTHAVPLVQFQKLDDDEAFTKFVTPVRLEKKSNHNHLAKCEQLVGDFIRPFALSRGWYEQGGDALITTLVNACMRFVTESLAG